MPWQPPLQLTREQCEALKGILVFLLSPQPSSNPVLINRKHISAQRRFRNVPSRQKEGGGRRDIWWQLMLERKGSAAGAGRIQPGVALEVPAPIGDALRQVEPTSRLQRGPARRGGTPALLSRKESLKTRLHPHCFVAFSNSYFLSSVIVMPCMLSCDSVLPFHCLLLLFVLLISHFSACAPRPPLLISTFIRVAGRKAQRMNNAFRLKRL